MNQPLGPFTGPFFTSLTKAFVYKILCNPLKYEWSFQGLGMLRLYISRKYRMHIWCPDRAFPNVSVLHTHPWDFTSYIVSGRIQNVLYSCSPPYVTRPESTHYQGRIKCGEGGGLVGDPIAVNLAPNANDLIEAGCCYSEKAEQIHESRPEPGTITIVERVFKPDAEHAFVFWPAKDGPKGWVSAEPRPANSFEVEYICKLALKNFKE